MMRRNPSLKVSNTETSLNFLGSKLFYNGRTREEEVKPAAKGNCEVACITPMETHHDENTNDYGNSSITNFIPMNCSEYKNCTTLYVLSNGPGQLPIKWVIERESLRSAKNSGGD